MNTRIYSIADRLQTALRERNVSITELSKRTGIPVCSLSLYKKGAYEPKADRIHQIAIALNIQEAWLMGFDGAEMDRGDYTEKEKALLTLFKAIPAERQGAVLDLLRAALNIQAK